MLPSIENNSGEKYRKTAPLKKKTRRNKVTNTNDITLERNFAETDVAKGSQGFRNLTEETAIFSVRHDAFNPTKEELEVGAKLS